MADYNIANPFNYVLAGDRDKVALAVQEAHLVWARGKTVSDDQLQLLADFYGAIHDKLTMLPLKFGQILIESVRTEKQRIDDMIYRRKHK